ncbi:hypothetical protein SAMN06273572_11279 [Monaibacterium marinum]|uniref:Uncharacterized protein n=1 Tax=Pontivivens marinum TaxID=1690039 RepID=A0A2C9CWB0_9RHOB|nr:hypothetical protein [Monaibacterium marinum]SOH95584.1 hypothetical protein SAMN06273572_11279 [Monaibacterium marinum]
MKPGIGHNKPPESATGWTRHCWTRARADLVGERLPIDMLRVRMARARQLGLSFPQYRSILLGGGRDVTAFLFTVEGLHLRLQRELSMPDPVRSKLAEVSNCGLMAFAPSGEVPEQFRQEVSEVSGVRFTAAGAEPEQSAGWRASRDAVHNLLRSEGLAAQTVVMIGNSARETGWADAAQLVKFIPRAEYFPVEA